MIAGHELVIRDVGSNYITARIFILHPLFGRKEIKVKGRKGGNKLSIHKGEETFSLISRGLKMGVIKYRFLGL